MMISLEPTEKEQIVFTQEVINRIKSNKKILAMCGNGGSLAEAQHFAGELVPIGVPAIAFNDLSVITAIANDFTYTSVYAKQILAFKHVLDTVFLMTTSGTSPNIRNAVDYLMDIEKKNHIHRILLTSDKSKIFHLGTPCEFCYLIQFKGDTQKVQEKTLEFIHIFYKETKQLWDM